MENYLEIFLHNFFFNSSITRWLMKLSCHVLSILFLIQGRSKTSLFAFFQNFYRLISCGPLPTVCFLQISHKDLVIKLSGNFGKISIILRDFDASLPKKLNSRLGNTYRLYFSELWECSGNLLFVS